MNLNDPELQALQAQEALWQATDEALGAYEAVLTQIKAWHEVHPDFFTGENSVS